MKTPGGYEYTITDGKIYASVDSVTWTEFESIESVDEYMKNNYPNGFSDEVKNTFINEPEDNLELDEKLSYAEKKIIKAQNRTTHAIRAFVRFLFIQLTSFTIGAVLVGISQVSSSSYDCQNYGECGASDFFLFIAGLVIIGGIIMSSIAGWSELGKSDVKWFDKLQFSTIQKI